MEKTTILKENLLKLVSIATRFVPIKPTIPVLGNLLIKAENGTLTVSATNLEMSIQIRTTSKGAEKWEITAPAKILNEFLATAAGNEVTMQVEKEAIKVELGHNQANIAGITASEFPKIPQEVKQGFIETDQKDLQNAVSSVAFSASVDDGKPVLTGILIKKEENKTILVATDGYRLSKKELKNSIDADETLISAKTLVEVLKIAGELEEEKLNIAISAEENQVVFGGENFTVAARLLAGTYPNFKQIIPTKFSSTFETNKQELIGAIKTTAIFARDVGNVVKFQVNKSGNLKITANTTQVGEGESLVNGTLEGEPIEIAFNSKYILDGLLAIKSETITLNFSGALSPALVQDKEDPSFIYIVMPVKAQH